MQAHPRHVRRRTFQDRWYGRTIIVLVVLAALWTLARHVTENLLQSFGL